MSLVRLDAVRSNLRLNPIGKIRVSLELVPVGTHQEAIFECMSCADLMIWRPLQVWWQCPSCGYELVPAEAEEVVEHARQQLAVLLSDVREKKGGRWRWVTWLLLLLRRKAA